MITIEKVEKLIKEIRKHSNLAQFVDELGEKFCKEYKIKGGQLNFLVCVVQAERMRDGNERLKREIINRRK